MLSIEIISTSYFLRQGLIQNHERSHRTQKIWLNPHISKCKDRRTIHCLLRTEETFGVVLRPIMQDAERCLIAITRFLTLYNYPTQVFYSDNGTNFYGADKVSRRMHKTIDHQHIQRTLRARRIDWLFNTPLTSAQGRPWEQLIRSARRILSSMPEDPEWHPPSEEVLRTLFALVQNILNSRPLTPVSCSVDDCRAITPASLMPDASGLTNPIGTLPTQASLRMSFAYINDPADKFWQTWMTHFLPFL